MKKVLVGMSGGVDSSVCLLLLKHMGYDVSGVTLKLYNNDTSDAKYVADKLCVPHYIFDFSDVFMQEVIKVFSNSYINGLTPNPCVVCNKNIKFGQMAKKAFEMGFDFISTGHYAQIEVDEKSGKYLLKKAKDLSKDQSYVLYNLTQADLAHILFPLGEFSKTEIREIATENGFICADKPDSQDICFVPDGDYVSFIKNNFGFNPPSGEFIDIDGKSIGKHEGIINYTIGQRKGLKTSFGKPMFVLDKDVKTNKITLAEDKDLFSNTLIAGDYNFIGDIPSNPMRVTAKTRYKQKETPALITVIDDKVHVEFEEPQRAITKGQSVVFYDSEVVIGGGIII